MTEHTRERDALFELVHINLVLAQISKEGYNIRGTEQTQEQFSHNGKEIGLNEQVHEKESERESEKERMREKERTNES